MSYKCQNCEREIKIDTLVDNDVWEKISPSKNEGGILCASCIAERISERYSGRKWAALRIISAHI